LAEQSLSASFAVFRFLPLVGSYCTFLLMAVSTLLGNDKS